MQIFTEKKVSVLFYDTIAFYNGTQKVRNGLSKIYSTGNMNASRNENEDYETRGAMGERNYFTDDSARDYDSYYAQVADDAMMGDESAMEEMRIYAKNSESKKMIARPHYVDKLIAKKENGLIKNNHWKQKLKNATKKAVYIFS